MGILCSCDSRSPCTNNPLTGQNVGKTPKKYCLKSCKFSKTTSAGNKAKIPDVFMYAKPSILFLASEANNKANTGVKNPDTNANSTMEPTEKESQRFTPAKV